MDVIDLHQNLTEKIAGYDKNSDLADIVFCIKKEKIPAHRFILAAQSDYWKKLLYGKFCRKKEILLENVCADAFKILLTFFYTGKLNLKEYSTEFIVNLLEMAHRFSVKELACKLVPYLCIVVDARTVGEVLRMSALMEIVEPKENCWTIIEMIIEGFYVDVELNLSFSQWCELLKRPKRVTELKLFQTILTCVQDVEERKQLISYIDFSRMTPNQLEEVWSTDAGLDPRAYIDLLQDFLHFKVDDACILGVIVSGDNPEYAFERGHENYTTHEDKDCIKVDLGSYQRINHLTFNLGNVWFAYYIEASRNNMDWYRVLDFSSFGCKGHQDVHFPEIVCRYIKFSGINFKQNNEHFGLNSLAMSNSAPNPAKSLGGFAVPDENVANNDKAVAFLTAGDGKFVQDKNLLSGNFDTFTTQKIANGCLAINFMQPYILGSCRFRFWNDDDRKYKYKVDVYSSRESFETVAHRSDEAGWQTIRFSPRTVDAIHIHGIECSVGNEMRLVHFEAPAQVLTDRFCGDN